MLADAWCKMSSVKLERSRQQERYRSRQFIRVQPQQPIERGEQSRQVVRQPPAVNPGIGNLGGNLCANQMVGNLGGWPQEGCLQQEPEGQREGYRPRQFVPVQQQQPMIILRQPQQAAPEEEEINRIKSVMLQYGYRVEYETKAEETRKIQQQQKEECCACCINELKCCLWFCICLILCIGIPFFSLIVKFLDSLLQ